MRNKIVAGNWKMNKNHQDALGLVTEIKGMYKDEVMNDATVILAPPFISLHAVNKLLDGTKIALAAQNMHHEKEGAYTGEVSAEMIKSVGCKYVITGHSERRQYFNETNELLALKNKHAVNNNISAIYCVGETITERTENRHFDIIKNQIEQGMKGLTQNDMQKIIVAYEPVWAIGTGITATASQAQEIHSYIREIIATIFDKQTAAETSILYGGSVKPENAHELFACQDIDGGLIGGAALKSRDFIEIVKSF